MGQVKGMEAQDQNWTGKLRDLQVLIRSLTKRGIQVKCQLQCGLRSEYVTEALEGESARIENKLAEALKRAESLIRVHAQLARDFELLLGIPGIAESTAVLFADAD